MNEARRQLYLREVFAHRGFREILCPDFETDGQGVDGAGAIRVSGFAILFHVCFY